MVKKIFFIIIFLTSFFEVKSQVHFPQKNAFVLDLGGIGGYGSANYEHSFFSKNNFLISGKIGFSFYRFKDYERKFNPDLLFPISINISRKWKNHHTIFGIGNTISSIIQASEGFDKKIRNWGTNGSLIFGYKFHKMGKPISVQFSYTPIFEHFEKFRHWGGISIGYFF